MAQMAAEPSIEPVMPNSSFWPLLVAMSVAGSWALVMTGIWWMPLIGLGVTGVGVFMWAFEDPFAGADWGDDHD